MCSCGQQGVRPLQGLRRVLGEVRPGREEKVRRLNVAPQGTHPLMTSGTRPAALPASDASPPSPLLRRVGDPFTSVDQGPQV